MPTSLSILTLLCAIVGAVLGIVNFLRELYNNRVRIRVTPFCGDFITVDGKMYFRSGNWAGEPRGQIPRDGILAVEVVNIGTFPVTIMSIDVLFARPVTVDGITSRIMTVVAVAQFDGKCLPHRIEPRDTMVLYCEKFTLDEPDLGMVTAVCARTACGLKIFGKSPALHQLVCEARRRTQRGQRTTA